MDQQQTKLLALLIALRIGLQKTYKNIPVDLTQTLHEIQKYIIEKVPDLSPGEAGSQVVKRTTIKATG